MTGETSDLQIREIRQRENDDELMMRYAELGEDPAAQGVFLNANPRLAELLAGTRAQNGSPSES